MTQKSSVMVAARSAPKAPSGRSSSFRYEPLDLSSAKPSIRLAILRPGTRESTIRITLAPTTFADRPRYEALSYTWGKPNIVKGIEVNGSRFDVRENLWAALVQLRSQTQERGLWVDAICINQSNVEERNHQVKLMTHIYSRAEKVLVWLGTGSQGFSVVSVDSPNGVRNICNLPYWRRVWIVQEVGSATELMVHWGKSSMPWDQFFESSSWTSVQKGNHPQKLAQQRDDRYGDSFLLANLIENCRDSLCEEPRDKIYGFVGIAHDCHDGTFPVDYSKSLFEVYEDVITFQSSVTKVRNEQSKVKYTSNEDHKKPLTFSEGQRPFVKRQMKLTLHFSQLIQRLLGGPTKMREDSFQHNPVLAQQSYWTSPFPPPQEMELSECFEPFRIFGVHSGTISKIGPTYGDVVGVPESVRKWKAELPNSDIDIDIEHLRKKNEGFMRALLSLSNSDLGKIFSIDPHFSWRRQQAGSLFMTKATAGANSKALFQFGMGRPNPTDASDTRREDGDFGDPRLFLTKTGIIGLIPPSAKPGDKVYQFWHSDSVAIVRKEGDYLRIVGRAVVANAFYVEGSKFYEPDNEFDEWEDRDEKIQEVYMDLRTLQLMTQ